MHQQWTNDSVNSPQSTESDGVDQLRAYQNDRETSIAVIVILGLKQEA
jgi:hypothetical protein